MTDARAEIRERAREVAEDTLPVQILTDLSDEELEKALCGY